MADESLSNDPVFPREGIYSGEYGATIVRAPADGLTKRELFAAMAMQGMLANDDTWSAEPLAQRAVTHADALLAALDVAQEKQP